MNAWRVTRVVIFSIVFLFKQAQVLFSQIKVWKDKVNAITTTGYDCLCVSQVPNVAFKMKLLITWLWEKHVTLFTLIALSYYNDALQCQMFFSSRCPFWLPQYFWLRLKDCKSSNLCRHRLILIFSRAQPWITCPRLW